PRNSIGSFGVTTTQSRDKIDGSKRNSQSTSASYSRPLWPEWTGQFFGSLTTTKNTSPTFPSDTSTLSVNSELAWTVEKQINLAFGLGYNKTQDKLAPVNSTNEVVLSTRYSYSF
ncbi:MAG: hypothetical protein KGL74_10550, partial [Elusimicrobia bacterium]|nr:hypothetical protein [Elusimicrobiota bacterium]